MKMRTISFDDTNYNTDSDVRLIEKIPAEVTRTLFQEKIEFATLEALTEFKWEDHMSDHGLARVIQKLPAKLRFPLTLFYVGDMTNDEIAKFLQIPLNTVKTHLLNARRRLAKILNAEKYDLMEQIQ